MVPCKSNAAAAPGVCCGRCGNCFFDDVDLVNEFNGSDRAVIVIMGGEQSLLPGIKIAEGFADYGITGLAVSLFGAKVYGFCFCGIDRTVYRWH